MNEIIGWSAIETAACIRARKVSVSEVVSAHLDRIEKVNPKINAITEVASDSLEIARGMDSRVGEENLPPLFGVPVTTKINVDQAGYSNSNGVPAFSKKICEKDSAVVANMKAAGTVVIGRTNTPEFSMRWCTSNPIYGITMNPWNAKITPGGSSGGASAAIAAGIGAIAQGNDLGGSLRYPAFCCGVAAIRPSLGRVPAFNPGASVERPPVTQLMSVQGPIARNIGDLRVGLDAMAARSKDDPSWTSAQDSGRVRGERLCVGYSTNPFVASVDPAIVNAVATAVDGLRDAGVEVVEFAPPGADRAARLWGELLFTENVQLIDDQVRNFGSGEMVTLFDAYLAHFGCLDLRGFVEGLRERKQIQRKWSAMFDEIDLFLMPTSLNLPFENDLDFKESSAIPSIIKSHAPLFAINLLGLPSVAIPVSANRGLPVGVQLVGPMHDDFFALDVAEMIEQQIGRPSDGLCGL